MSALVDQEARARIERDGLGQTLFVEAGAGTGKTYELVQRVVNLVLVEQVPIADIAAITFTEAAAAELRDRIREEFEKRSADPTTSPEHQAACHVALDEIDGAAIGTLHSFALRILGERPLDVELPPKVEILDEVSSQLAFEDRWSAFVDLLYDDPTAEELLLRAQMLGLRIDSSVQGVATAKDLARIFDDNWDRLEEAGVPERSPLEPADFTPIADAIDAIEALRPECRDPDDLLARHIEDKVLPLGRAVLAEPDPYRRMSFLDALTKLTAGRGGKSECWVDRDAAKATVRSLPAAAAEVRNRLSDEVLVRLGDRIAVFTLAAAEDRRAEGRLEFHDLLVFARRLLRTSAAARADLHGRYRRLLLDEFQDTDPIQIALAVLIASVVGGEVGDDWRDVPTEPGHLFFVGDPKQSIYRFRRADIGLFMDARGAFVDGDALSLVQNFRTVGPVLDWVNHVFGRLMAEEEPRQQPRYEALTADRGVPDAAEHRVVVLGQGHDDLRAAQVREVEADDVATAIALIRDDPGAWPVYDRRRGAWRPAELSDVTVLIPTRTSLRYLEDAFERHGVAYRVDTGTLVYDTQEIREALAALQAIDDPSDAISLVAALRSPLYACSDVDLFAWREAGGRWSLRADPPEGIAETHPVAEAVAHLRSLWEERWWLEPSALLDRLLRERRAHVLAFAHRRPREVWRRLRFLVDQARVYQEAGSGGGLRGFIAWAELQRHEGSRVHEPLLPEPDDVAVSILTVHGAKGLEFPITVVAGASTVYQGRRRGVQVLWDEAGQPQVSFRRDLATDSFDRLADVEAEMDVSERHRLLYVACTRARDHLLVSAHHLANKNSNGRLVDEHSAGEEGPLWCRLGDRRVDLAPPTPMAAPTAPPLPLDDREGWIETRERLLEPHRGSRFLSATVVADLVAGEAFTEPEELEPAETDDVDAPVTHWRRGRAGTAIGRAVHATLQVADLATGDGIDAVAVQQAHVESVADAVATITALARSALRAASVQAAVASDRLWREVYVAAPLGDRAVEGYIDLLYDDGDGLVVVDYKTDSVSSEAEVDAKVDRYRLQVAVYAAALEASTGRPVRAARLVFCTPGQPIERDVTDLAGAIDEVRGRLAAVP